MKKQVEAWKATRIPDQASKLVIYRAFVEGAMDVPKHLARRVHDLYFNPQVEEFGPRTTWSLSKTRSRAPSKTLIPSHSSGRWWPVVNVGTDGSVNVVYYESQETETASNPECIRGVGGGIFRVGTANSLVDTFWVQSVDGGSSFATPVTVTTATSNWCTTVSNIRPNFGDYIGSTTSTIGVKKILPVWADGRNGVPDTFFAAILP